MKLPHTEVKFYPEMKSQTGLSSLRVSCKRALRSVKQKSDKLSDNDCLYPLNIICSDKWFASLIN